MKKNNGIQILIMTFWVTLSAVLQTISLTSFSIPGGIYPSGITGLSRFFSDVLRDFFSISLPFEVPYFLINAILAIFVYCHIGKLFTIFSLLQTALTSLFSTFIPQIITLEEMMLIAIFGGLVNGAGIGFALSHGASSGGMDFLSIYFSNKYHRSMWNMTFGLNCILIAATGLLYGWERAAYSIVFQFMSNFMINKMHKRYTHQAIIVVTRKPNEVIETVLKNVRHGITKISAQGAYKGEDESVLYTVVNTFQTSEVVRYVLEADPNAFIETRDTASIYGNYYQKPLD